MEYLPYQSISMNLRDILYQMMNPFWTVDNYESFLEKLELIYSAGKKYFSDIFS